MGWGDDHLCGAARRGSALLVVCLLFDGSTARVSQRRRKPAARDVGSVRTRAIPTAWHAATHQGSGPVQAAWLPPEVAERLGTQFRVAGGMLDVAVAEPE